MSHVDYHIRQKDNSELAIKWSIAILTAFIVIEYIGAVISNSIALLSDAGHLATDVLAMSIALFGFWIGKKAPTEKYTYGFMRAEVIAAFINALLWFVLFAFIIWESVDRLINPVEVDPNTLLPVAILGLIANLVVFKILHANHTGNSINMRGAILHVILDIFGSIAAIISGIVIYFTDWYYADSIIGILLAALILKSGWELLKDCVSIMMEHKPDYISEEDIRKTVLSKAPDVEDIHHVHIWELSGRKVAMTLHVTLKEKGDCNSAIYLTKRALYEDFGVTHCTVQAEHGTCPDEEYYGIS
jgi:cobalt-zinc-cadmium efflux system protein